jgi:hypothetical protein
MYKTHIITDYQAVVKNIQIWKRIFSLKKIWNNHIIKSNTYFNSIYIFKVSYLINWNISFS